MKPVLKDEVFRSNPKGPGLNFDIDSGLNGLLSDHLVTKAETITLFNKEIEISSTLAAA